MAGGHKRIAFISSHSCVLLESLMNSSNLLIFLMDMPDHAFPPPLGEISTCEGDIKN